MSKFLKLEELYCGYDDVPIINGISLSVERGSVTALVGSNGAGKTTLMRTLSGLLPLTQGKIIFDNESIGNWAPNQRVDIGLSLVPEGRLIFPEFSVEENLRIGAVTPRAKKKLRSRMEEMFELFPRLKERREQSGGTLSGGEQQMLAIARSLCQTLNYSCLMSPAFG